MAAPSLERRPSEGAESLVAGEDGPAEEGEREDAELGEAALGHVGGHDSPSVSGLDVDLDKDIGAGYSENFGEAAGDNDGDESLDDDGDEGGAPRWSELRKVNESMSPKVRKPRKLGECGSEWESTPSAHRGLPRWAEGV